jgi:hypothetical protein
VDPDDYNLLLQPCICGEVASVLDCWGLEQAPPNTCWAEINATMPSGDANSVLQMLINIDNVDHGLARVRSFFKQCAYDNCLMCDWADRP